MQLINNAAGAPPAVGPYSQAVRSGGFLFCSGQLPIDPASASITTEDIEGQTRQVFANIRSVLTSQELNLACVVKATVFLQDMAHFPLVNAIYNTEFEGHKPARSTVQVAKLPLGALVEIEVIAELG